MSEPGWEFWIDRGGTFTDVVARAPDGRLIVEKLLSDNPGRYRDAATEAVRRILADEGENLASARVDAVKMGTTVATNALLERKGEPTVLAITTGHADALRIGWQSRPDIFARRIVLPEPLYSSVIEVDERVTAEGEVLRPLDEAAARRGLQAAFDAGFRAVAIVLMHGWRFTDHEARVGAMAREIGFAQVSVSHEVAPLIKLVSRGDTAVVDAYLSPILRRYVDRVAEELGPATRLLFMQSSGGLAEARAFRGKDAVLSGPAGGVVGMSKTATQAGFERVIGFDMGGTSTDVSHYAGELERISETVVAGVRLRAPMAAVHTVAAGGGSICRFDGARLRVGPQSAGADPGPACYRHGGPLTVTDCNLVLGKILPEHFPSVFGRGGDQPLDRDAAERAMAGAAKALERETGVRLTAETLAEGFVAIAVQTMAEAIKRVSVQAGHDPAGYALASFGGAGGQHACLVAEALGITTVVIHPLAGVLSAYGMGLADLRVVRQATVGVPLGGDAAGLDARMDALAAAAETQLRGQGLPVASVEVLRRAELKYAGTDSTLTIAWRAPETMRADFHALHERRFGFAAPETPVFVEAMVAEAVGGATDGFIRPHHGEGQTGAAGQGGEGAPQPIRQTAVRSGGQRRDAEVYARAGLVVGAEINGPAVIFEQAATTVVEPGWTARVDDLHNLVLTRTENREGHLTPPTLTGSARLSLPMMGRDEALVDPVRLELFANLFMAVAERMGDALQSTASSVNIKERLDFSCALFDASGGLIANAPHIPVHLGSMGESVRAVMAGRRGDGRGLRPGDVYMLNAPYNGGTHLPDITVILPVFEDPEAAPLFWVAARGHHADVGGITPGSMPPLSRTVGEEGVLIDDFLLVEDGRLREAQTRALLGSGAWPARNPDQNLADLKAQVAACRRGADEIQTLIDRFGRNTVMAYMDHVQNNAEESVRRVIDALGDGAFEVEADDGWAIRVAVRVDRADRSATIDFTGTDAQLATNFNAPLSITRAAALYVFRTLVDDAIPLNEGCLKPLKLIVPEGCLLNPKAPAAVVAGNVETSQMVVDALYGALGALAGSQGTMNNFTFGDEVRQYYETICGGSGAGPGFDGASAVQTHMTNSRLTDPEVLEARFPVLVERFAVRPGSGGAGASRGGDGVERSIRFRELMTAAILSNRRRVAPCGLAGGEDGAPGVNTLERADGTREPLSATAAVEVRAGDALIIQTPGGGGFGLAASGGDGTTGRSSLTPIRPASG